MKLRPNANLMLFALLAACGGSPEQGESEEALNARLRFSSGCTPFMAAALERSMFYARIVASSPAFQQCVRNTMRARYINCGNPNAGLPRETQIDKVLEMLRRFNNPLVFQCDVTKQGTASANYQGYGTHDEHAFTIKDQWHEMFWTSSRYGDQTGTGDDYEPWHWRAGTMLHEFSHSHDFKHEGGCNDGEGSGSNNGTFGLPDCMDPTCAWTSRCPGGSGIPPAGLTLATAGEAQQEFCAYRDFGADSVYFSNGEPSLPYIFSGCAQNVVAQSHGICGKATTTCGRHDSLRLLSVWTGLEDTAQPANAACSCQSDPRHMFSLRTSDGYLLSAAGGGGSTVLTRAATNRGANEIFYTVDQNGGDLGNWDPVIVETFNGSFLVPPFLADGTQPNTLFIGRSGLTGSIASGSVVNLRAATLAGDRYATSAGSNLASTSNPNVPTAAFTLVEPVRDTMVYLRTAHSRYVDVDRAGARLLYNRTLHSMLSTGTPTEKSQAAFWVLDHNRGSLMSGELISLESFDLDGHRWVTVGATGTGQVQLTDRHGPNEQFTITKVSGAPGPAIVNDDVVTFRSGFGLYLIAKSPADPTFPAQIRHGAALTGTAHHFTFRHVAQLDQTRHTW